MRHIPDKNTLSNWWPWVHMGVILSLWTFLSLYKLDRHYFLDSDEFRIYFSVNFRENFLSLFQGDIGAFGFLFEATARPGYVLIGALGDLIFNQGARSIYYVNILLGNLMIIFFYKTVKQFFPTRVALGTAVILAVSANLIHYSRSGWTQIMSLAFLVFGLYCYSKNHLTGRRLYLIACGFFLGFSFTTHPSIGICLLIPLSIELLQFIRALADRKFDFNPIRKGFFIVSGFLIPLLMFQIPYLLVLIIKGRSFDRFNYIGGMLFYGSDSINHGLRGALYYFRILPYSLGYVYFLLLLAGMVFFIHLWIKKPFEFRYLFFGMWFIIPVFLTHSKPHGIYARFSVPGYLPCTLFICFFLWDEFRDLWPGFAFRRYIQFPALFFLCFLGIYHCVPVIKLYNPSGEVLQWLKNNRIKRFMAQEFFDIELCRQYKIGIKGIWNMKDLRRFYEKEGIRYFVTNPQVMNLHSFGYDFQMPIEPEVRFINPYSYLPRLFEVASFEVAQRIFKNPQNSFIGIYDLDKIFQ